VSFAWLRRCAVALSLRFERYIVASSSWLPSFSSVVWSALRAGSCGFVSWRVSLHAASGRVAVASFAAHAVASAFAAAWARRLGHSVVVRRLSSG